VRPFQILRILSVWTWSCLGALLTYLYVTGLTSSAAKCAWLIRLSVTPSVRIQWSLRAPVPSTFTRSRSVLPAAAVSLRGSFCGFPTGSCLRLRHQLLSTRGICNQFYIWTPAHLPLHWGRLVDSAEHHIVPTIEYNSCICNRNFRSETHK
jgi:hypothetical protein